MTRAANVLHVAQPSLSRQMQVLEHELGVLLFVRSDRGVQLTEAGQVLQERANAVLQQVRQIRDEIGLQAREPMGVLRCGLPASLFELLTVPLLCDYRERYPQVQLRVTEGPSVALHEMMITGRLDTAVVSDAEPLQMLRSHLLLREQLYLVGPLDAGLRIEEELPLLALAERPLILTSQPNAMRVLVDRGLADADLRVEPVIEANSSRLLCELAERGKGFTVLPFSAVAEPYRAGRVSISPVRDLAVTWVLVIARDRGLSLAARKLREMISEIASQQIAAGAWQGVIALE